MSVEFPGESAEYRAARARLLVEEIALRRAMEAVAEARRALPQGGLAPEDYLFDSAVFDAPSADGTPEGTQFKVKLSELFAPGKDSLVIYNFMFPRMPQDTRPKPTAGATAQLDQNDGPCASCTAILDSLDGAAKHMEAGGLNFVVVAKAPIERVMAFAKDRGWRNLRLLSSAGNSFKRDYLAESLDGTQLPMVTVFQREGDGIRHFWSSELMFAEADAGQDPRQTGTLDMIWNVFDLTKMGRPADWDEQFNYDCCCPPVVHIALPQMR